MKRQDTNSSSFKGSTTSQSGSYTDGDQDMDKVYRRYRETLMNTSRLVTDEGGIDMDGDCLGMGVIRKEVDLTNDEKQYLLAVERGDIPSTRQYLSVGTQTGLNINCVDPLGRTALLVAIENENIEMIELLLSYHVDVGDSLLHAINEENVEAVELLLNHEYALKGEEALHQTVPSSSFTPDITPIILAAHRDNYEIIKLLLDRGYRIPKPHDVRCICKNCLHGSNEDSLRHSRSRINAYRALASPSLIALSSKDPILTSFELSRELKRLSKLENEFKLDYEKLAKKCKEFAVDLLEQTRGSKELEIILNHDIGNHGVTSPEQTEPPAEEKVRLSRLKLAIKFNQKKFVAHPNCQQLLASIWYEGLPGFRRHSVIRRLFVTSLIGVMFPFLSIFYLVAPKSGPGKLLRKPFIKFICHSASYLTFLVLLILVSQRVEIPFPWADKAVVVSDIDKISQEVRGAPATNVEWMILAYVAGLVWAEVKQLWDEGAHEYVHDMWNILDFVTNSLYIATLTLRVIAYLQVQQEKAEGKASANLQRKDWNAYDPNLIAEALFAAANIFSSLKLIYMFTVNPHLGPLQISLGRMIVDIMKFAIVYMMVLFSFSCGLNHLYWYYATLREKECKIYNIQASCDRRYKSFANLFEIIQSLYWSIYGLVDLEHAELEEPHEFTEFIGKLMFGSYSWIALVVLLNLLIAMMSNSYQNISSQADEEWKFARSKLWISYFEDSGTLPPPFNIIPSPKTFYYLLLWFKSKLCACSKHQKRSRWQSIRKIVKKINEREIRYQAVMRDLIKRYIMQKQRGPERGEGVTEDDVSEIKQDISSFRYELLEILRSNGMKTPNPNQPKPTNRRRVSSRKRSQMLNRSFGKGMSGVFPSNGCLDLGSKPTTPTFGNGGTIPDTIVEESVGDTRGSLGEGLLGVRSISPSPSTSNLIDFSPEATGQSGSALHRKQKASLHLQALRTDEGLGESIDLNSEHSNYSPKLADKFEADTQRPSKHEADTQRPSKHERNSGSYLDPDFAMLSNYSPGEGHTDRSGKRVTFL